MLSYWDRDKMAAIFATAFSKQFFSMKIVVFWFQFHLNTFNYPSDNKPAIIRIITWHRTDYNLVSGPMMAKFGDTYIYVTRPLWVKSSTGRPIAKFDSRVYTEPVPKGPAYQKMSKFLKNNIGVKALSLFQEFVVIVSIRMKFGNWWWIHNEYKLHQR